VRILFWGSPGFAIPSLERLIRSDHRVVGVVTREDKPSGRGRKVQPTPIKARALETGLEILQPARADDPGFLARVRSLSPDISVVVAYGKILKKEALDLPPLKSICIHPSLLPRYRGASPVQRAVLAGETETGVTIFRMDEGMDSGDILIQVKTPIREGERAGELMERLGLLSSEVLMVLLSLMEAGEVHPVPQEEAKATYAPKVKAEEARIDWRKEPRALELESRAFDPWPGSYAFLGGERVHLFGIRNVRWSGVPAGAPGEVVGVEEDGTVVRAGSGFVKVTEFQSAGKRRMDAASWLRGRRMDRGVIFGP